MEEKVLLLSDSACDITKEVEAQLPNVRIINMLLTVNGKGVVDRDEISLDEIYEVLNHCEELPTTSHISAMRFVEEYLRAAQEGYTHLIYLGINGKGSSTFEASVHAKTLFAQEYPELARKITIYNVDSRCYSYGIGFPLVLAQRELARGKTAKEVVDFLVDYIDHRMEYVSIYTLKYAKRSGRINAVWAFVGEMLGLRPIMGFTDGENVIHDKVRGDKAIVNRMFEYYKNDIISLDEDYCVLWGEDEQPARELIAMIEAYSGKKPLLTGRIGACVACNSGPKILGITFRVKEGGHYSAEVQ